MTSETNGIRRAGRTVAVLLAAAGVAAASLTATLSLTADGGESSRPTRAPSAKEAAKIELGRRLFFDPEVSRSGKSSCASCHDPDHGFSDPGRVSDDDFGRTRRHSQTVLDAADNPTAHWDGEFDTLEELVEARLGLPSERKGTFMSGGGRSGYGGRVPTTPEGTDGPPFDPTEDDDDEEEDDPAPPPPTTPSDPVPGDTKPKGADPDDEKPAPEDERDADAHPQRRGVHGAPVPDAFDLTRLEPVHVRLERAGRYGEALEAVYGSPSVTTARLADAIGEYVRSVRSTESAFDRFERGDSSALSPAAKRGLGLFRGRAGCAKCHSLGGAHAPLTDYEFHNTGIAFRRIALDQKSKGSAVAAFREGVDVLDLGRAAFSTGRGHRRAFKTPTLRDVAKRGPYMHDGSFRTLAKVVRYYAKGGANDPLQSEDLRAFTASDEDVSDLVAFLRSLSGEVRPGLAPTAWAARAGKTRLRFLDGDGKPVANLAVSVVPAGDTLPGDVPATSPVQERTTDAKGWIEYVPPLRTHVRLALPDGLEATGGSLVPDTCARSDVVLPLRGKAVVIVSLPAGLEAPGVLALEHETEMEMPATILPRSVFVKEGTLEVGGRTVARYSGWLRTDRSATVRVRLPGDGGATNGRRVTLKADSPVLLHVAETQTKGT